MTASHNQAIHSALSQNWDEAVAQNLAILDKQPDDIEALNRLGFAYLQTGNYDKARAIYKRVLAIDRYNAIALKNLQKAKVQGSLKSAQTVDNKRKDGNIGISPSLFLEEPGRTKIVSLVNVAPNNILFNHSIGEQVSLTVKRQTLEVRSGRKDYLGALPDDLGFRLRRLILSGNRYQVFIKSVSKNSISIFIKELKRSKRFRNQPTFPANGDVPGYSFMRRDSTDEDLLGGDSSFSADDSDE